MDPSLMIRDLKCLIYFSTWCWIVSTVRSAVWSRKPRWLRRRGWHPRPPLWVWTHQCKYNTTSGLRNKIFYSQKKNIFYLSLPFRKLFGKQNETSWFLLTLSSVFLFFFDKPKCCWEHASFCFFQNKKNRICQGTSENPNWEEPWMKRKFSKFRKFAKHDFC